jgi:hypothetical protein
VRGLVLLEGTVARPGGQIQTVTGVAARLPLRSVQATCQPPAVTIVTGPTSSLIPIGEPSLDVVIVLEGVTLTRPVDPADKAAAAQLCALAGMLEEHPNGPNPTWAS